MTVSAASSTAAAAPTATTGDTSALGTLSNNFTNFLQLLMTQLKNQDPTSPMDTNQFTSQLVQFTGVQQQINTNASLTTLIQATQGNTLLNSSNLIGKDVEVTSDQVSLQNGKAGLNITAPTAEPVNIGIYSASGAKLLDTAVTASAGSNRWTWDGKDSNGQTLPDGAYKVVVADSAGGTVPFTVLGTATGVQRSGTALKVALGSLQVDFSAVQTLASQ